MFRVGDKIVCINGYPGLYTEGKSYEVKNAPADYETSRISVYSDNGTTYWYDRCNFIPIKQFRRNKLLKIMKDKVSVKYHTI